MIRKISLSFNGSELENQYQTWTHDKQSNRFSMSIGMSCLYLICSIVQFQQQQVIGPLVAASIALVCQVVLIILMRKYTNNMEALLLCNQLILATVSEIYRHYCLTNRWYISNQIGVLKIIFFIQGNQFLQQALMSIIGESMQFIYMEQAGATEVMIHIMQMGTLIVLRYTLEFKRREHYLEKKLKEQYENLLEDLLPAWVVLVKFNKFQCQLSMDKINKEFQQNLELYDNKRFRDFLRQLLICPLVGGTRGSIVDSMQLEAIIIKQLQQKSEDNQIVRYYGMIQKEQKRNFKISQVYFNTFEPTILLLFEEITEDKYEQLQQNIIWRDQQTANHCKSINYYIQGTLKQLSNDLSIMKNMRSLLMSSKNDRLNNLTEGLIETIQSGYLTFNQTLNQLNLLKINYSQIKYELSSFNLASILTQLNQDMQFKINKEIPQIQINTDKSKLISIIVSISEFIRLMLSMNNNDESILYQLNPMGYPISISIKPSKLRDDSYQIALSHHKLQISEEMMQCLGKQFSGSDHKKRHWGLNNYFQNIKHISEQFIIMTQNSHERRPLHKLPSAMAELEQFSQTRIQQRQAIKIDGNVEPFSTLGFPLAQYFVSQIGPFNKIFISQQLLRLESFRDNNNNVTKLKFLIYKDLSVLVKELNSHQPHPLLDLFQRPSSMIIPSFARTPTKKQSKFFQTSKLNTKIQ